MKINQSQFVEAFAAHAGIRYTEAERLVNSLKHFVYDNLHNGNTVEFSGFGQFMPQDRAARIGVNPQTLEKITIPALRTAKFKAGEAMKAAVKLKQ